MTNTTARTNQAVTRIWLFGSLMSAFRGWSVWKKIKKTDGFNESCAAILIDDEVLEDAALKHLDEFLKKRKMKKAIIITANRKLLTQMDWGSNRILKVIRITRKQGLDLMRLFSLYEFDKYCRLVCVSLTRPYGRCGDLMLEDSSLACNATSGAPGQAQGRITPEDIVTIGIYRLYADNC